MPSPDGPGCSCGPSSCWRLWPPGGLRPKKKRWGSNGERAGGHRGSSGGSRRQAALAGAVTHALFLLLVKSLHRAPLWVPALTVAGSLLGATFGGRFASPLARERVTYAVYLLLGGVAAGVLTVAAASP
jgi:hypothetical protein